MRSIPILYYSMNTSALYRLLLTRNCVTGRWSVSIPALSELVATSHSWFTCTAVVSHFETSLAHSLVSYDLITLMLYSLQSCLTCNFPRSAASPKKRKIKIKKGGSYSVWHLQPFPCYLLIWSFWKMEGWILSPVHHRGVGGLLPCECPLCPQYEYYFFERCTLNECF